MTMPAARAVNPRQYTDLRLELRNFDAGTGRYAVSLSGAVGEFDGTGRLAEDELAESLAELADGGIEEDEDRIAFGRALADRLLPDGGIRIQVTEAIRRAGPGTGVRLRLVTSQPRLAALPWEYTYLSLLEREDPADFLVLNPVVSLVRHEQLPLPPGELHAAEPSELRLLAVTANAPGYPQLDLERERGALETALAGLPGRPAATDLPAGPREPHGRWTADGARPRGRPVPFRRPRRGARRRRVPGAAARRRRAGELSADRLGRLLQAAGVRLAVLGACDSGRRGRSQWAGVVPGLVAGAAIPAVVAMQCPVRNSAAVTFASQFYTAVAAGRSIDEAVTDGRLALLDPDDLSASWGIPVLYLRSSDGVLFPRLAERPSATADKLRSIVDLRVQSVQRGEVTGIDTAGLTRPGRSHGRSACVSAGRPAAPVRCAVRRLHEGVCRGTEGSRRYRARLLAQLVDLREALRPLGDAELKAWPDTGFAVEVRAPRNRAGELITQVQQALSRREDPGAELSQLVAAFTRIRDLIRDRMPAAAAQPARSGSPRPSQPGP